MDDRDVLPLRVRDLAIRHDGRTGNTPAGVSFDIAPGEVVLLLGPSGCGKSTLALALNGLVPHAVPARLAGAVIAGGIDTMDATVAQLSEKVAMVFQDPDAQIVTGSVLDEVCFGPENLGLPVEVGLARAEASLRAVGLWERRAENPDLLSGGGRQRLSIACALAMGAPLLVLDEPTANLDPVGIDEVYAVLRDLVTQGDKSILLIEHNLDAAIELIDRVIVLDSGGRVALNGTPGAVLAARAEDVAALGVWLPVATLAALRLRRAGVEIDPLPLTGAQLAAALDGIRVLPEPAARARLQRRGDEAAVRVRDLTVVRSGSTLLDSVSLDIAAGDFTAVIGTNGAGKTTLVQAIAGVVPPPRGRITVAGLDPTTSDVRALAAHIGFVFQNPEHQFLENTVWDELAYGLRLAGGSMDAAGVESTVTGMLERFGLEELRDAHPFLLSGGQKRRLSVGTALVTGAPVLVLDEPTFGQDRERADELLALLTVLNRGGRTIIAATHDLQLVAEYAHSVAVLSSGKLLAFGPTAEILGDAELIARAGLRLPPLATAMGAVEKHPSWRSVTRLADLPGSPS
ncbi:ABC transporter ATP-binding protein [Mycetocola miduiensis]|uniref:Energy-coupling factor transport system ATP-binding protein n=1 Tax=Mycetocola miduiensis TaxID=995034 RepID=A0A1I5B6Q8_9MICO|nr:ATP-binding cassette domain-containing protein [Mycetocola miduiensis]SFN70396.1 energy-coupling factor transport system ATP-binding protein [Mycetocola miduiensis]